MAPYMLMTVGTPADSASAIPTGTATAATDRPAAMSLGNHAIW